eukprot:gene5258-6544_t
MNNNNNSATVASATVVNNNNNVAAEGVVQDLRTVGLGTLSMIDDRTLLNDVFTNFTVEELLKYQSVSPAFYVILNDDKLWKDTFLAQIKGRKEPIKYLGNWKISSLTYLFPKQAESSPFPFKQLNFSTFYSLEIYQRWLRRHMAVSNYGTDPGEIQHIESSELTVQEFIDQFERPSIPVIFKGEQKDWPATKKWTKEQLVEKYGDITFKISHNGHKRIPMQFKEYAAYMSSNTDEEPLYVFDEAFGEKAPELLEDYKIPKYFPEDLFAVSGDARPHYRWIVIGPPRSGAPWHIDPAGTSAWNSLLVGRKRWLLYPPSITPIGVALEDIDEKFYGSLPSLLWLLEIYPFLPPDQKPIEVIQNPGETIFVPGGWWHMVLNMEESIAVTQNYCDTQNFRNVCEELSDDPKEYTNFKKCLLEKKPEFQKNFDEFELLEFQVRHAFDNMELWGPRVLDVCNRHLKEEGITLEQIKPPISGQSPVFIVNKKFVVKFYSTEFGGDKAQRHESHLYSLVGKDQHLSTVFPKLLAKGNLTDLDHPTNGNTSYEEAKKQKKNENCNEANGNDEPCHKKGYIENTQTWKWPYLITTFVEGINLQEIQIVPESMSYPYPPPPEEESDEEEEEPKPKVDTDSLITFLVNALTKLHSIPIDTNPETSLLKDTTDKWSLWKENLKVLESNYKSNHWHWGGLPVHLRGPLMLDTYLPKDFNQLIDQHLPPVYLHNDLTDENVLGDVSKQLEANDSKKKKSATSKLKKAKKLLFHSKRKSPHSSGSWKPHSLIDLGDSNVGDRWYEIVSLHLSIFAGDKARLKTFLSKYKFSDSVGVDSSLIGKSWLDYYKKNPKEFIKRAMSYTLIHHCDALTTVCRHYPSYRNAKSIDHLAQLIWDIDYKEEN